MIRNARYKNLSAVVLMLVFTTFVNGSASRNTSTNSQGLKRTILRRLRIMKSLPSNVVKYGQVPKAASLIPLSYIEAYDSKNTSSTSTSTSTGSKGKGKKCSKGKGKGKGKGHTDYDTEAPSSAPSLSPFDLRDCDSYANEW
jgi:hypothetical protein